MGQIANQMLLDLLQKAKNQFGNRTKAKTALKFSKLPESDKFLKSDKLPKSDKSDSEQIK